MELSLCYIAGNAGVGRDYLGKFDAADTESAVGVIS